ncbi:ATP-binding protein [Pseudomethylobacillus aquaticus]|uniref:ATP-binding protein n=1 Tax=Pseudomethylobacillus aquaticus TaxID=2676064 RepID=A0A3N0UXJ4_9PROT|nr:ATP-binding protein [Pseudomethylobacillus aquaticus]ROH85266.1 ATP-binding protein [Pseudomethylobacillus aquaticus]
MLLEFRVRNYRSIRDEVVLSFVASKDKKLAETHLATTGISSLPNVLRSAVVYGPNASGKSTLLQALFYMRAVVAESATIMQPGQTFNVQPFRLDMEYAKQPSEFEITFLLDGVRHQYGFTLTPERIVDEWLLVYRAPKPQQWFRRSFNEETQSSDYEFSITHLTGPRKLWQEATRPNALFLSTAAQLNSELLGPIFRWLVEQPDYFGAGLSPLPDLTTQLLQTELGKKAVREFLASADISISDVVSVSRPGFQQQILFGPDGANFSREEREILMPQFVHHTEHGSATFELHEESEGTQRLYALIAPVLDVLKNGRLLIVDELDRSLHPLLVRRLVRMFHMPELNPLGAQLLFSTHDTSLLDRTLFRRDQIWFTEKDRDQATRLFPLSDFSPRETEAWEKGYLIGRYGAVPFFDEPVPPTQAAG